VAGRRRDHLSEGSRRREAPRSTWRPRCQVSRPRPPHDPHRTPHLPAHTPRARSRAPCIHHSSLLAPFILAGDARSRWSSLACAQGAPEPLSELPSKPPPSCRRAAAKPPPRRRRAVAEPPPSRGDEPPPSRRAAAEPPPTCRREPPVCALPQARLPRPLGPPRRSHRVPLRASPPAAWLPRPSIRAGWVAPATGRGQWGAGASPLPRTLTPPAWGGYRYP